MSTTAIEGTPFTLEYIPAYGVHTVSIYAGGTFWDWRDFPTEAEARAFIADPFKTERQQAEQLAAREAARIAESDAIAERNASLIGCNRGWQVGPNRRGSI